MNCKKCGSKMAGPAYESMCGYERLMYKCRCGYSCTAPTLDSSDKPVGVSGHLGAFFKRRERDAQ